MGVGGRSREAEKRSDEELEVWRDRAGGTLGGGGVKIQAANLSIQGLWTVYGSRRAAIRSRWTGSGAAERLRTLAHVYATGRSDRAKRTSGQSGIQLTFWAVTVKQHATIHSHRRRGVREGWER